LTIGDFYDGAKGTFSLSKDNLLPDMVPVVVKKSMQSNARTKVERLGLNGRLRDIWWNLSRLEAKTIARLCEKNKPIFLAEMW
jgi:hypothetical protein